jgi:hypothetical protein
MNEAFDSILEACLARLTSGESTVADCLAAHPQLAGELEPLLVAAHRLRSLPRPSLPPSARVRIEAQVLQAFDARLATAAAASAARPPSRPHPSWRWVPAGLGALAAVALVVLALVGLSRPALPGSPLYGVKRTAEQVQLWLAPAESEPGLHVRFAERRLEELEELAERDEFDPAVLQAL